MEPNYTAALRQMYGSFGPGMPNLRMQPGMPSQQLQQAGFVRPNQQQTQWPSQGYAALPALPGGQAQQGGQSQMPSGAGVIGGLFGGGGGMQRPGVMGGGGMGGGGQMMQPWSNAGGSGGGRSMGEASLNTWQPRQGVPQGPYGAALQWMSPAQASAGYTGSAAIPQRAAMSQMPFNPLNQQSAQYYGIR